MYETKKANPNLKQCFSLPPSKIPSNKEKKKPPPATSTFLMRNASTSQNNLSILDHSSPWNSMKMQKLPPASIKPNQLWDFSAISSTAEMSTSKPSTIYVSCPLNALLWGCETWNLSAKNLKKLEAFHHGAARRILNIKWQQVHEDKIRNKQVRFRFCNVPKVETFIQCRIAKYLGKVARSNERSYPKKFLGAWMNQPKKNGGVQLSCNDTFAKAISAILPPKKNLSSQMPVQRLDP
jgi:hypothetical protein